MELENQHPFQLLTKELAARLSIGWKEVEDLYQSRMNKKGWGILWLAVLRGLKGYDRPQFVEDPAVVIVIRNARGQVAFIKTTKANRPRLMKALVPCSGKSYVANMCEDGRFAELMAESSVESIELPAGLVDPEDFDLNGTSTQLTRRYRAAVRRAAIREAEEETGLHVEIVESFFDIANPNTAWFLHPYSVIVVNAVSVCVQRLDATEGAKKLCWYSPTQIRKLIKHGKIFDSRTVHALVLAGVL